MWVMTLDGNFGKAVTGTKITVDGTHDNGTLDGVDTIKWFGMVKLDGNWETWIGTIVDGKETVDTYVGGKVFEIECGIETVDGIWMLVITDDGNFGNSVTGTKITVDGTHEAGMLDGVETTKWFGMWTDDGNWVTWIGTKVDGNSTWVGLDGTQVQNPGVDG